MALGARAVRGWARQRAVDASRARFWSFRSSLKNRVLDTLDGSMDLGGWQWLFIIEGVPSVSRRAGGIQWSIEAIILSQS
jgi:hypothetical protein